jgi:hypothetical protein
VKPRPEVFAARGGLYRQRHIELAEQLRAALNAAREINDALHQNFRDAETEFPYVRRRTGSPPYPPAAGLIDLSWHELRHNVYASEGGRFGGWSKRVDHFINPDSVIPAAPRPRRSYVSEDTGQRNLDRLTAIIRNEGLDEQRDKATIQQHIDRLNREAEAR